MPMWLPMRGMDAARNTAAATLPGNLSMARATLSPPRLWPTRTSRSPPGAAAPAPPLGASLLRPLQVRLSSTCLPAVACGADLITRFEIQLAPRGFVIPTERLTGKLVSRLRSSA